jgi:uncharacterized protein (DUF1778 family)
MSKKHRQSPRVIAQGGPKVTVSIRLAPNDLRLIQSGAQAAGETQSDTFTAGALTRARSVLSRRGASPSTQD